MPGFFILKIKKIFLKPVDFTKHNCYNIIVLVRLALIPIAKGDKDQYEIYKGIDRNHAFNGA